MKKILIMFRSLYSWFTGVSYIYLFIGGAHRIWLMSINLFYVMGNFKKLKQTIIEIRKKEVIKNINEIKYLNEQDLEDEKDEEIFGKAQLKERKEEREERDIELIELQRMLSDSATDDVWLWWRLHCVNLIKSFNMLSGSQNIEKLFDEVFNKVPARIQAVDTYSRVSKILKHFKPHTRTKYRRWRFRRFKFKIKRSLRKFIRKSLHVHIPTLTYSNQIGEHTSNFGETFAVLDDLIELTETQSDDAAFYISERNHRYTRLYSRYANEFLNQIYLKTYPRVKIVHALHLGSTPPFGLNTWRFKRKRIFSKLKYYDKGGRKKRKRIKRTVYKSGNTWIGYLIKLYLRMPISYDRYLFRNLDILKNLKWRTPMVRLGEAYRMALYQRQNQWLNIFRTLYVDRELSPFLYLSYPNKTMNPLCYPILIGKFDKIMHRYIWQVRVRFFDWYRIVWFDIFNTYIKYIYTRIYLILNCLMWNYKIIFVLVRFDIKLIYRIILLFIFKKVTKFNNFKEQHINKIKSLMFKKQFHLLLRLYRILKSKIRP